MKLTVTVVLCTFAVLLQQMEMPMAQYCPNPDCSPGAIFDRYNCACNNFTKSTCPDGTAEIVDRKGRCSCQAVVHPMCDKGYTLNPKTCTCKIDVEPTCPDGTRLIPANARCIGSDEPYCPKGFQRVGCKCIKEVRRECEDGGILTANDCKCKNSYPPTCSGHGCSLNTDNGKCTCEQEDTNRIQCYYNKRCKGKGRYVSSEAECCYQYPDDYDGDRSAHTLQYIRPYSYNNGYGQCYTCYYYYYYNKRYRQ